MNSMTPENLREKKKLVKITEWHQNKDDGKFWHNRWQISMRHPQASALSCDRHSSFPFPSPVSYHWGLAFWWNLFLCIRWLSLSHALCGYESGCVNVHVHAHVHEMTEEAPGWTLAGPGQCTSTLCHFLQKLGEQPEVSSEDGASVNNKTFITVYMKNSLRWIWKFYCRGYEKLFVRKCYV